MEELFSSILSAALSLFQMEIHLFGFQFTLLQVFLFDAVAGIAAWFIGRLFSDG